MLLPSGGLQGVEGEADGEHGDGEVVDLAEHRHQMSGTRSIGEAK